MAEASLNDASEKFARKMWITKGCRFSAHTRLSKKSSLSTISTAVISFYIVAASIVPFVPSLIKFFDTPLLSLISCLASILIIIVSVSENGAEYGKQAIEMFRCGTEISCQYDLLRCRQKTGSLDEESLRGFIEEYHNIIARYPNNHAMSDMNRFKLENGAEFCLKENQGACGVFLMWLSVQFSFILYYAAMLFPPALLVSWVLIYR